MLGAQRCAPMIVQRARKKSIQAKWGNRPKREAGNSEIASGGRWRDSSFGSFTSLAPAVAWNDRRRVHRP